MSLLGVIGNPTAASGRGARWTAEALSSLTAAGHRVHDFSQGSWAGSLEYARLHRDSIDALVVVGGDGMVHLGLQVCAGSELPLGIVAAGSGNDGASQLGLPIHSIDKAVQRISAGLHGDTHDIDVGRVTVGSGRESETRYFLAVLSAGLDAQVAARALSMKRPRGPMKYQVATLLELPKFSPYGVRIGLEGQVIEQSCTLVAVANGSAFGGGLMISPDSSMRDGVLELVLADGLSRWEITKLFPKLKTGGHLSHPACHVIRTKQVTISSVPGQTHLPPVFADGELIGADPIDVAVAPRALRVLGARPE